MRVGAHHGPLISLAESAFSRDGEPHGVDCFEAFYKSSKKIVMRGALPGERRGGRCQGTPNRATTKNKATLSELAQIHTPAALATLAAIMNDKDAPAAARVAASNAILDRAYGKPRQEHDLAGEHGPIVVVIREFAFSEDSDGPDFANANAGNALQAGCGDP